MQLLYQTPVRMTILIFPFSTIYRIHRLLIFPLFGLQLQIHHMLVDTILLFQLLRCSLFCYRAILQYHDLVYPVYGTHISANSELSLSSSFDYTQDLNLFPVYYKKFFNKFLLLFQNTCVSLRIFQLPKLLQIRFLPEFHSSPFHNSHSNNKMAGKKGLFPQPLVV